MSTEEQRLTDEIARIDARITSANDQITAIDAELVPVENTELQACLDMQKNQLQTLVTRLTTRKSELEAELALFTSGWTGSHLTMVDAINSEFPDIYTYHLDQLMKLSEEKQDEFFTLYGQATTTLQKQIVMSQFDFYDTS